MLYVLPADKVELVNQSTLKLNERGEVSPAAIKFMVDFLWNVLGAGVTVALNVSAAAIGNRIHGSPYYNDLEFVAKTTAIGASIIAVAGILIGTFYSRNYPSLSSIAQRRSSIGVLMEVIALTLAAGIASIDLGQAIIRSYPKNYLRATEIGAAGAALELAVFFLGRTLYDALRPVRALALDSESAKSTVTFNWGVVGPRDKFTIDEQTRLVSDIENRPIPGTIITDGPSIPSSITNLTTS